MNNNYSFLNDYLALIEIRKHKWLESEKQGYEIGFATAAVDWIKKYGQAWLPYRLGLAKENDFLAEKRRLRRFPYQFPLELKWPQGRIVCQTQDINMLGLSCAIPADIPEKSLTRVTIRFKKENIALPPQEFQFDSRVKRVGLVGGTPRHAAYRIFLPFSNEVREYLFAHAAALGN